MKTYRNLFARVCSPENLERACHAAARGRRLRPEIAWFLFQREARLGMLLERLRAGEFTPQPGRLQLIRDPKPRAIVITPFETRVVHHAVCDVIEALLSRSYIYDTWACLEGRGSHRAVLRLMGFMQRHRYLVQLDVRKYFLSIPRARLLERLEERLRDRPLLCLIQRLIEQEPWYYDDTSVRLHLGDPAFRSRRGCGLAIGHLTSQVFGNFYLSPLDHFAKRELKIGGWLRYMDNGLVLGDSRAQLKRWIVSLQRFLWEELGLTLNEERVRIHPCTAKVEALGYRVSREWVEPGPRLYARIQRVLGRAMKGPLGPHQLRGLKQRLESYRGLLTAV